MNRSKTIPIFVVVGLAAAALVLAFRTNHLQAPPAAAGASAAGFTVHPYLQNPGLTAMTIEYVAARPGEGLVKFGSAGKLDQSSRAQPLEKTDPAAPEARIYRAHLTGLRPDTDYRYRVAHSPAGGQGAAESAPATFRTWPEKAQRVVFVAYGDSRSGTEYHRQLADFMAARKPAFVLHTGDAIDNESGIDDWQREFFEPLARLSDHVPLFFARGNHDSSAEDVALWFEPPAGRTWRSFDYGGLLHVAVIDCYDETPENLAWLDKDLAAAKAAWKFVTYHEPTFYYGYHDSQYGRETVLPLIEKHKVDFVVAGHDHLYGRYWPLRPRGGPEGHVITFIVSGGGGARLYPAAKNLSVMAKADSTHHYCLFTIEGGKLNLETFNLRDHHIDRLTVTKTDGRYDAAYLKQARPMAEALKEHEPLPPAPPENETGE